MTTRYISDQEGSLMMKKEIAKDIKLFVDKRDHS